MSVLIVYSASWPVYGQQVTGAALQSAATPTLGAASLSWLLRPAPTLRLPHGARPRTEGGLGKAGDNVKSYLGYIL